VGSEALKQRIGFAIDELAAFFPAQKLAAAE
jgi:hypothetical protein